MKKEKNNYEMIEKIYKQLNEKYNCNELFLEGFTSEQIFYQSEKLCNTVLENNQKKIDKMYKKYLLLENNKIQDKGYRENQTACVKKDDNLQLENSDNLENEDSSQDNLLTENISIVEEFKSDSSEDFERQKKLLEEDESDISEEDEDTLSDEGSIEDIEDLKDIPASELFKKLDKNIKK